MKKLLFSYGKSQAEKGVNVLVLDAMGPVFCNTTRPFLLLQVLHAQISLSLSLSRTQSYMLSYMLSLGGTLHPGLQCSDIDSQCAMFKPIRSPDETTPKVRCA